MSGCCSEPNCRRKHPLYLFRGGLTGRWYVATRWRHDGHRFVAIEKHELTEDQSAQLEAQVDILASFLTERYGGPWRFYDNQPLEEPMGAIEMAVRLLDGDAKGLLTIDDLRRVVSEFTYRPGWTFAVWVHPHEGVHLTINADVPNAYRPGETVHLDIHAPLPPFRTEQAFEDWLLWRLARIEVHEAAEFLMRNGRRVRDPHAEIVKT